MLTAAALFVSGWAARIASAQSPGFADLSACQRA